MPFAAAATPRPGVEYVPWSAKDGRVIRVDQEGITAVRRVVLEVRVGPVCARTTFVVAQGGGFEALLGVDFLYEHDIAANLAQHTLVFEAHDQAAVPLVGHNPRLKNACMLPHDIATPPGRCVWARARCDTATRDRVASDAPNVFLVHVFIDKERRLIGPEQIIGDLVEIKSFEETSVHLPSGWQLARVHPMREDDISTRNLLACLLGVPQLPAAMAGTDDASDFRLER